MTKNSNDLLVTLTIGELQEVIQGVITNTTKGEAKDTELMTRHEVMDYLHISAPTLGRWVNSGKLRKVKIGGKAYFNKEEITSLIR